MRALRRAVKRFVLRYRTVVMSVTLVYCGQTVGWIKMKLGMRVVRSPGHIGDPQRALPPKCRPIYVVAKWLDGLRCHLVGLGPGDFVLDGDPAESSPAPKKERSRAILGPCLLWPNGWMDQDGTWHGGDACSWPYCLHGDPAPLPKRRQSPQFSAHFYCGQTVV